VVSLWFPPLSLLLLHFDVLFRFHLSNLLLLWVGNKIIY
jgi:hypothetical protein